MPYWISATLTAYPVYLLIVFGIGIPWAYALLPPDERRDRVLLIGAAIPTGAALITIWLFIVGTVGAISTQATAIGAGVLTIAGVLAALGRRAPGKPTPSPRARLAVDERLLIGLMALAVLVAAIVTAFWTFTAYDTLWVYGYQARLYALTGAIPASIGYYPPFMPLLYAIAQTGGIDDHAARAIVPILHVGAILAAYTLGKLLDGRRTGVVLAALWALYPHVGEWSRAGDLEIALTMSFTLASAFFLRAWLRAGEPGARRDAALAGLAFGVALWTKPTAGAFAIGVALMGAIALARELMQGDRAVSALVTRLRPRIVVTAITALACAPLGGVWYVRNLLLGHNAVDFPPAFWNTIAERGGDEFGFPLLAIGLVTAALWIAHARARDPRLVIGLALCCAAVARSILVLNLSLDARRLHLVELAALAAGAGVWGWGVIRFLRTADGAPLRPIAARLGWAAVLATPYFAVWFWSYSYHYRLSFAVVPLLLLPVAVVTARSLDLARWRAAWRPLALVGVAALALPGIISPIADKFVGDDYLFTDELPNDDSRYRSGNAALMRVVEGLRIWQDEHPGERLIVSAPGIVRLPFFFPLEAIRTDHPIRLEAIEDAAYYIYGIPETAGGYADTPFLTNQVIGVLGREDLVRRAWWMDDGTFSYDVYELHLSRRWIAPTMNGVASDEVIFGGFARYLGYDLGGLELWTGRPLMATLYFQVIAPPPADYSIFLHLRDNEGDLIANWDDPVGRGTLGYQTYYTTTVWDVGEYITEIRTLRLPDGVSPYGSGYTLEIGFYDPLSDTRAPVSVNGIAAPSNYVIENRFGIIPPPSE